MDPENMTMDQRAAAAGPVDSETVDAAVASFCEEAGGPQFALDDDGVAWIPLGDDRTLVLVHYPSQPGLAIAAPLPAEVAQDEEALRLLLDANLTPELTDGGVFAMPPGAEAPMLMRLVTTADLKAGALADEAEALIELVEDWIDALADRGEDEPDDAPRGATGAMV